MVLCTAVQGRGWVGGCISSPVTSLTFCTNEKGWYVEVWESKVSPCSSRYCLGKAGAFPPLSTHLLYACFSPLPPLLHHLHSYLISLCFSTVHHYLSVCSPLSSITLSHRFPSYYQGICLHLSKNKTHTHTCAAVRLEDNCRCVPVCQGSCVIWPCFSADWSALAWVCLITLNLYLNLVREVSTNRYEMWVRPGKLLDKYPSKRGLCAFLEE